MSTGAATLLSRLAALRETSNKSPVSECKQATPLATYLLLYSLANKECYIDYMEGARLLKSWLGEIAIPVDTYPEILNPNFKVPSLLSGYESQELATIISGETFGREHTVAANAIYFVMSREVISYTY